MTYCEQDHGAEEPRRDTTDVVSEFRDLRSDADRTLSGTGVLPTSAYAVIENTRDTTPAVDSWECDLKALVA